MFKPTQISIWLMLVVTAILASCNDDSQGDLLKEGNLTINVSRTDLARAGGRSLENREPASILLSVDGPTELSMEKINLYAFEGNYISEAIALLGGSYQLTDFLVLDHEDEVIYASPKYGSEFDHLVEYPLPLNFEIEGDAVTKIEPEVLSVLETSPDQFGYATFDFKVVKTMLIAVIGGDDLVEADLQIWSGEDKLATETLYPETNRIALPGDYDEYTFIIEKQGYLRYKAVISRDNVDSFNDTPFTIDLRPAVTLTVYASTPTVNHLDISMFEQGILYFDYADIDEPDTFLIQTIGDDVTRIPLPLSNNEYFVSISGELDKIRSIKTDYDVLVQDIDVGNASNLQNLFILLPSMSSLEFKPGSSIEELTLSGGLVGPIDISSLDNLIYLDIFGPQYETTGKMLSKMLYESLTANPRYGGYVILTFLNPLDEEAFKYMKLIEQEFQWTVSYYGP